MKTETTRMPKFVLSHIEDIRIDGFLHDKPALVDVNAPRALIQATAEGHLQGIAWVLRQPLYAATPDLLATLKALATHRSVPCRFTITKKAGDCYTCGRNDRLCQQCAEVVAARAAIAKAVPR